MSTNPPYEPVRRVSDPEVWKVDRAFPRNRVLSDPPKKCKTGGSLTRFLRNAVSTGSWPWGPSLFLGFRPRHRQPPKNSVMAGDGNKEDPRSWNSCWHPAHWLPLGPKAERQRPGTHLLVVPTGIRVLRPTILLDASDHQKEFQEVTHRLVLLDARRLLFPSSPATGSQAWRWREKTHASSPSTSGKTHEKTSVIQTRH